MIDEGLRGQLLAAGFAQRDDRVLIDAATVTAFLDEERARHGNSFSPQPEPTHSDEPITYCVIDTE